MNRTDRTAVRATAPTTPHRRRAASTTHPLVYGLIGGRGGGGPGETHQEVPPDKGERAARPDLVKGVAGRCASGAVR